MFCVTVRRDESVTYWERQPVSRFEDDIWVDVCGPLNDRNSKLQGKCQLVSELHIDISASRMKFSLFLSCLWN